MTCSSLGSAGLYGVVLRFEVVLVKFSCWQSKVFLVDVCRALFIPERSLTTSRIPFAVVVGARGSSVRFSREWCGSGVGCNMKKLPVAPSVSTTRKAPKFCSLQACNGTSKP